MPFDTGSTILSQLLAEGSDYDISVVKYVRVASQGELKLEKVISRSMNWR